MNLLRNRPLATCCMVFLLTLTVAANTDSLTKLWLGGAAVFFLLLSALIFKWRKARLPLLAPLCVLLSLLALLDGYLQFDRRFCMAEDYPGEVTVCARVREITYTNGSVLGFRADCETVNGAPDDRRITVWAYTELLPEEGDRVTFHASLQGVSGEDSLSLYLRAKGVAAQAEDVFDLSPVKADYRPQDRLRALFADLRSTLGNHLSDHIPGESGLLMRALLLGEQELLPDRIALHFRRTGLSHVLSLSGLHISLLVGALAALCHRLRCPRYAAVTGQIVLVLFYMALTGFSLSITRAGLMTLLFALSFFARRETDGITSLSLAAVLILLFSPTAVYDCGYWLSVVATYGILIRNEWRNTVPAPRTLFGRIGRALKDSLCVTLAATFATLPLTASFFGETSLLSPLSNLLLIPLFNLYLLVSIIALPLAPLSWFSQAVSMLGNLLLSAVKQGAFLPGTMLSVNDTPIKLLLFALLITLFACLCSPMGRKKIAIVTFCSLTLLALVIGTAEIYRTTVTGAYYGYAGENEVLLLQSGRKGLLCDLSNGSYTAQKNGLRAAKQAHITELEGYLITHYHASLSSALPRLCGQILIRTLYLPIPESAEEEAIYRTLTARAAELGMTCVLYEVYNDIPFGSLTVHPHAKGQNGSLHPTLALSVRHGEQLLTYLGAGHHESDQKKQATLAVAKSSLLIFGVHGSKEEAPPSYPTFSASLSQVILPYKERIEPSLAAFLDARLRIAAESDLVWIKL